MGTPIEIVDGKYELLTEIGHGGMSVVYLARDSRLNKQWAIKKVSREMKLKNGDVYLQSLLTEAEMMKRLDHPAIARIVDIIEQPNVIYIVMDYIEGQSLDVVLKEYGAQPQEVVVDWIMQIADALNYLHSQKPPIIYRDMKPSNVMLRPEGAVRLIDFGTAREYKGNGKADTVPFLTHGYAAPEQSTSRESDPRTDIYALGMTMHQLLTGVDPSTRNEDYHPVRYYKPEIHEGLERIVEKCTRYDPADRYQNCSELMYALQHYEEDTEAYRKMQKRKVGMFFAAAGLSVALLLVSLGSYLTGQAIKKSDYNEYVSISTSLPYEQKAASYKEAVKLDPTRLEAYDGLIEAIEAEGVFDQEKSQLLASLWKQYSGDRDTEEYLDLCYRIGYMYFNFYEENGEASLQARINKSAEYFEEINGILEGDPSLSFDKRNITDSYYTITQFYKKSSMTLTEEHTAEQLNELISAFSSCVDALDEVDKNITGEAKAIKLGQYKLIVQQLNKQSTEFAPAGVKKETVLALLSEIESRVKTIDLAELTEEKQVCLEACVDFSENLERAYA